MKIITVANAAGSAGKTTTVVSLAAHLAERGRRVVVVDLDGQANSTRWFGLDPDEIDATSAALMLREVSLEDALVETNTPGVRLVPANERVHADGIRLQQVTGREMRLATALRKLEDADVVLIDCPGTIGLMTVAALVASEAVVTVTQPTSKELEGIGALEATIAEVAEDFDKALELDAIVPCIVPPTSSGALYADAIAQLRDAYGDLVTPNVRRSVKAAGAYSHREPLPVFAPREGVTRDYAAVLDALIEREVFPA